MKLKQKREEKTGRSSICGAMDGASKFVKNDAVAGIIITFINIIGGPILEPLVSQQENHLLGSS